MNLLIFTLIAIILSSLLLFLGYFIPKRKIDLKKRYPYECGFDPLKSARLPFSFRFFLIGILFLIFDLEIALLFPIIPSTKYDKKTLAIISCVFLFILARGLAYE